MDGDSLIPVKGSIIDDETRCIHYHSDLDIIAIKFKCCNTYYSCFKCHEEKAGHLSQTWKKEEWSTKAILCGACKTELSILQYLGCSYECPACGEMFNPGCKNHNHLYFEQ